MTRPTLFGIDMAGVINEAMGADLLPATLTRPVPGTRAGGSLSGGETVGATSTAYPCRGYCENYRTREIDGTLVRVGDRKIMLLGGSLPDAIDPQPGDLIAIEGATWRVVNGVERDPAAATFICQGRR
jgi:hypothetical protein